MAQARYLIRHRQTHARRTCTRYTRCRGSARPAAVQVVVPDRLAPENTASAPLWLPEGLPPPPWWGRWATGRRPTNGERARADRHRTFGCSLCFARYTLTPPPRRAPRLSPPPHPPLTTFLGRWLCFVEPRRWRALLVCPSGPLSHTIPTSRSDSPCHMHARCLPPVSLNDYHQFVRVSSTRVRRDFASSATFTVTLPSSRATISENQISCSLTV